MKITDQQSTTAALSHEKRFFPQKAQDGRYYAAASNGSPNMLHVVDQSAFKKTDEEKAELATHKSKLPKTKTHKFERQFIGAF